MKKIFSLFLAVMAMSSMANAAVQQVQATVGCGTVKHISATPKTGYHFVEWNDGNTQNPREVTVNADITYTATFAIDTFTIRFLNGEAVVSTQKVTYNSMPTVPTPNPTKASTVDKDYTFDSWSPAVAVATANQDYVAVFTESARKYTITWIGGNGETLREDQVAYGETPSYGSTPTKTGEGKTYTFTGWSPAVVAVEGNATYTAQFSESAITYNVTYAKGSPAAEISGSVDVTVKTHGVTATLANGGFTRTGYTQDGWATSDGGDKAYELGGEYTANAAITLYPHWAINHYTITYAAGTGATGTVASTDKTHGTAATLSSSTFTREGYTQDGWSLTDGGAKAYELGGSYTDNAAITLYPHWAINHYTISVSAGEGGSVSGSGNYDYGQSVTITATADECYEFVKWSDNNTNPSRTFSAAEDVTLTAIFQVVNHTLTVQSADDTMGTVSIDD